MSLDNLPDGYNWTEIPTVLPDLSEVDLSQLRDRADPVLAAALARVAEQALSGEQVVAGFNSAI